jgi:hypothetical protein
MSMYQQHRGIPQNASRLSELLDQIRQEFDQQVRLNEGYEQQSKSQSTDQTDKPRRQPSVCSAQLSKLPETMGRPQKLTTI